MFKDGKAFGVKDVEIIVQEDKVVMKLKKSVRSASGPHQIKMSNAQGETTKEVFINIQGTIGNKETVVNYQLSDFSVIPDVPSAPEDIQVQDVFQDSCVLKWKKPKDDGGMPILNYVIERQDLSVKGLLIYYYKNFPSIKLNCIEKQLSNRWMASSWRISPG